MSKVEEIAVVVTTAHRGVFFGLLPADADFTSPTLRLRNCRMCVKWPEGNHSVVGLAAWGPVPGARVSPAAPAITLHSITGIMECSVEAIAAWESEPWS